MMAEAQGGLSQFKILTLCLSGWFVGCSGCSIWLSFLPLRRPIEAKSP